MPKASLSQVFVVLKKFAVLYFCGKKVCFAEMRQRRFREYAEERRRLTKQHKVDGTKDLTQGTIWKQLLFFALPLLGSSLVQQLYNTVDLLFVGNFL